MFIVAPIKGFTCINAPPSINAHIDIFSPFLFFPRDVPSAIASPLVRSEVSVIAMTELVNALANLTSMEDAVRSAKMDITNSQVCMVTGVDVEGVSGGSPTCRWCWWMVNVIYYHVHIDFENL